MYVALRRPISTVAIGGPPHGLRDYPWPWPRARIHASLNEGDSLHADHLPEHLDSRRRGGSAVPGARAADFPEVDTVFGKLGRSETPTDPRPITMVETTVLLKPGRDGERKHHDRWYSGAAPEC